MQASDAPERKVQGLSQRTSETISGADIGMYVDVCSLFTTKVKKNIRNIFFLSLSPRAFRFFRKGQAPFDLSYPEEYLRTKLRCSVQMFVVL